MRPPGERVKRIREALGMKQHTLALAAGLTEDQLGNIERGTTRLLFEVAWELARALGCNMEDFIDDGRPNQRVTLTFNPGPEPPAAPGP